MKILDKVFKSRASTIFGRQLLKNLKGCGLAMSDMFVVCGT